MHQMPQPYVYWHVRQTLAQSNSVLAVTTYTNLYELATLASETIAKTNLPKYPYDSNIA